MTVNKNKWISFFHSCCQQQAKRSKGITLWKISVFEKISSPVSRNEMGWLTVSQELWLVYINLKNILLASHSKYTDQWHIWMNRTILTSELHSTSPRGYNFLSLWNNLQGSAELYYSWKRNTAVLWCNQLSDQKDYCTIIGIYVANE